jgi:hypothetical protein
MTRRGGSGGVAIVSVAERELVVVQVPHPGAEHDPGGFAVMGWNQAEHRRKFLRSDGRYLDADGVLRAGAVTFWGEWEAPSRVVSRHPAAGAGMPRFVHEPLMQPGEARARRKNTGPFVFGGAFLHSNCRQFTSERNPSRMQRLAPSWLALFGSTLDGCFVLDTAMVIGSAEPYVIGGPDPFGDDVPDAFRAAALEPLAASKLNGVGATLYRGRMYELGRQEMFSFVPVAGDGRLFARPIIEVPRFVDPRNAESAQATPVTASKVAAAWHEVVG